MQYLCFPFTPEASRALRFGLDPVTITIDHPFYQASVVVPAKTQAALAQDLE